jgi:hypothetical protein
MDSVKVPQEWSRNKKVKIISMSLITVFLVLSILILVN